MRIKTMPFYDRPENKEALRKLIALLIADGWDQKSISNYFHGLDCHFADNVIKTFFINTL